MNPVVVGVAVVFTVLCGVSEGRCIASSRLVALLILSMKYMTMSVPSGVSIARSERLSSSGVEFAPLVGNLESALTAR